MRNSEILDIYEKILPKLVAMLDNDELQLSDSFHLISAIEILRTTLLASFRMDYYS